jgi:hypothetical protein
MTIQLLTVSSMNEEQLISFADIEFPDHFDEPIGCSIESREDIVNWVGVFLDKEPRTDFSLESLQASIETAFPDMYPFDGNEYVPDSEEYEEKGHCCEMQDLPLLGHCRIYPTLDRIVYEEKLFEVDDLFYKEGARYKIVGVDRRMSFEEYRTKLIAEQAKIADTLLQLDKPAE